MSTSEKTSEANSNGSQGSGADKKAFVFTITYFKESGKYYTHSDVTWDISTCGNGSAYMADACSKLRGLRDCGGPGAMPGLSGDGWDGFILIDCEDGYPCLIKPRGES